MSDRKLIWGSALLAALFSLILFLTPPNSLSYWLGLLTGSGLGVITIVWDRKLKRAGKSSQPINSIWIPLSVIGGMWLGRLVLRSLGLDLQVFLINSVGSWLVLVLIYSAFTIWSRSRKP